ncbi:MAG: hypothetical protein E7426_06160 [Ruminococcaceae bacterium]|nr:hypothetical protein [Oscillospiraceae bacterium]
MERAYDERTGFYFYRKNRYSVLFLLVLGFAIGSVGYHQERGGVFLIIGIAFGLMAVWQWFRQRSVKVTGAEVDETAARCISEEKLERNAQVELALDQEDMEGLETLTLRGYAPMGIKTEPLFRVDPEDGRARSSNYQSTHFILEDTLLYTYTEVKSLIDSEFYSGGRVWRFDAVTGCGLEEMRRACVTTLRKENEKVERPFPVLMLRGENGEAFAFAFSEEFRAAAEHITQYVAQRIGAAGSADRPARGRHAAVRAPKTLSRKERRAVEIGTIGDSLDELR